MSSSYREELNRWLSMLDVGAESVLDIGGSQEKVKDRVRSWDVEKYVIGDIPEPHAESPKPDVVIDLNGRAETKGRFDVIFCLEVFDYVYDPVNAFHIISTLLKDDGYAYVSFPFIYPQHNPLEDDCLRYTIHGIRKLAEATGLKVVHYLERKPETSITRFYVAERMRAAKNVDHEVTGWIVRLEK